MTIRDSNNNTVSSVQQPAQQAVQQPLPILFGRAHYDDTSAPRESSLDAACSAAGPGFAVVADRDQVRGVVRFDLESEQISKGGHSMAASGERSGVANSDRGNTQPNDRSGGVAPAVTTGQT